jgi:O-acetyl-ADP-ribose deacetylase (regulator of RNase III)
MFGNDLVEEFNFNGKSVSVIFGDITQVKADVIVSSDDNHISMGGGVSMAIHKAAGDDIWNESRKYVPAQLGEALVTKAGNLSAKYIFHAIVIDFEQAMWPDVGILRTATVNCLQQAEKLQCETIALPAFGTGAGGLSSETAAITVINAILENLVKAHWIQRVFLVLNRRDTLFDFITNAIEARVRSEYQPKLDALRAEKEKLIIELQEKSPYRKLPYPIAVARHLADSYNNYHSKFTSTIECAESILKFCASVMLAEYIHLNPSAKEGLFNFFKSPASLGSWQTQLESILGDLKSKSKFSAIPQIGNAYFSKNKGYFSEIIKERNEKHGHGSTLADDVYKPAYEKLISKVDAIVKDFAFLEKFPLIVVENTDFTETGITYEVTKLMGDNVIFSKDSIVVSSLRLHKHALYMFDMASEQALCLHPFLIFETCPYCQIQETFFLEKNSEKESVYHTYRANHRITTDKYISLLQKPKVD